jgi:hypothetical protein
MCASHAVLPTSVIKIADEPNLTVRAIDDGRDNRPLGTPAGSFCGPLYTERGPATFKPEAMQRAVSGDERLDAIALVQPAPVTAVASRISPSWLFSSFAIFSS